MQYFLHRMTSQNKFFSAFIANVVPIIGVLFFQWSVFSILLAYWLENIVIGFFQFLKMRRATMNYPVNERNSLVPGPLRPVKPAERMVMPIFFLVHFGIFSFVHLGLLRALVARPQDSQNFTLSILCSLVPFFIIYGKSYVQEYILPKEYEKVPMARLMFSAYPRVVVMHLVILIGAFPVMLLTGISPKFSLLLILLKIVVDVVIEQKAKQLFAKIDAAQAEKNKAAELKK